MKQHIHDLEPGKIRKLLKNIQGKAEKNRSSHLLCSSLQKKLSRESKAAQAI